jgi:dethiobiotin synthetase
MGKVVFISGGDTGVGKTYITLQLIEALARRGVRVGAIKPIETGIELFRPGESDGEQILAQLKRFNPSLDWKLSQISPYRFKLSASPAVAGRVDPRHLVEHTLRLAEEVELLLVEGAGGIMVPITDHYSMLEFGEELGGGIVVVLSSRLGVINSYHLNRFLLEKRGIGRSLFLINLMEDSYWEITYPYLKKFHLPIWQRQREEVVEAILNL